MKTPRPISWPKPPQLARWFVVVWLGCFLHVQAEIAARDSKRAKASGDTTQAMAVLRDNCVSCHGLGKTKGGLSLMTRELALKGGDEGPALNASKLVESRLLQLVEPGADPHMPPKKQLDPTQVAQLKSWVKAGAPWDVAALDPDAAPIVPVKLRPLPLGARPGFAAALNPEATQLLFTTGEHLSLHRLTATNQPLLAQAQTAGDPIFSLAWSPDAQTIASGGFRSLRLWSANDLSQRLVITNALVDRISALAFAPDGQSLAVADGLNGRSGIVRIVDPATGGIKAAWRAHSDTIFDLEFSRDSSKLLTSSGDKLVRVWDVATHKELATLEGHTAQVLGASFNSNATQVVSGGADKQLKVWDIATKERIIALGNHSAAITAVAWPGNSTTVFAATDAGGVYRYTNLKPHTGEQSSATADETKIGDMTDAVLGLAVSDTTQYILATDHLGVARLWDGSPKLLATLGTNSPAMTQAVEVPKSLIAAPTPKPIAVKDVIKPKKSVQPVKSSQITSISIEPSTLTLYADSPRHRVIVTARLQDGTELDFTSFAKFSAPRKAPFEVDGQGIVTARGPGSGELEVLAGGKRVGVPVSISARRDAGTNGLADVSLKWTSSPPSFVRDVLPVLNRTGCSAGSCHAKADGQNGFKLSVFSYDPKADYAEIVKDVHGRRVFPSAPDESMILKKALGEMPHEGGQRFQEGSAPHQLIYRWLSDGLPFSSTNEPALTHISVFPKERSYRKGASQPLLVQAHYSDGSLRDVTHLAAFDSNEKEIAKVDEDGRVTIGTLTGQGVIVTRYMGFVAPSMILVPAEKLLPEASYAQLPRINFIDDLAYAQFKRLGLFPSDPATDMELLRRASLDTIGVLPKPEELKRHAEAMKAGGEQRSGAYQRYIDELLARPEFGDYWANRWADLLRPNPDRVGVKSVLVLDQWLRESFQANKPYDQFVRDIIVAEGSNHRSGPAVVYRDRRDPPELTTMFSQLFLGTRLECAKCHHHPNEKWSQDDFYQLAAYFGPVKQKGAGLSPPISAGTETFYFAPGGAVHHPVSGAVMAPKPPDGPELKSDGSLDPRKALADWLTTPENPFFGRAAANRVWANFFGRGLVDPVDDFRVSNPCVNPALLDALAKDFAEHHYDLKHLVRTILSSHLYQLSSTPNDTNLADTKNFSRSYRRRLPAEVLLDAVCDVTGVPESFAAMPAGYRAMQTWSYKIESHFLDAFGRPNASSDCPCERDRQMSVVQSLHLMNSKNIQSKLSSPDGRAHQLAASDRTPEEIITELYFLTLARPPSDDELRIATGVFNDPKANRQSATEDVFWALLNSPEFVLNH